MKNFFLLASLLTGLLTGCQSPKSESAHASGYLLVANKGNHTLSIIDPVTGQQLTAVDEEGVTGHEVVASADGRWAFVPIFGNAGVGRPGTDGSVIRGARFQTNLADHVRVLESECMIEHAQGPVPGRHVNWVVESLRRA